MKFNSIQSNFSSGELSRNLKGRTNVEEYYNGVEEMTNFIPFKNGGGAYLRPGTVWSSNYFDTSITDPYAIVEFSPRDGENYLVALNPSNGTKQIAITRVNGGGLATVTKPSYIWNKNFNFSLSPQAYTSLGSISHQKKVDRLQFAQSGDTLIIVDGTGELAPIAILRTALNTFVVDSILYPTIVNSDTGLPYLYLPNATIMRVPFKDTNIQAGIRLKPSATTGTITITSENASAAAINFFKGDVVGMWVKINHSTTMGAALITAKISDSSVTASVAITFGGTTASNTFEVSAWNSNDGYPKSVAFFEQRLVFGGNKTFPDTLWLSNTGNIYHFMQRRLTQDKGTTDVTLMNFYGDVKVTDPFSFIPASVGANSIQWLFPTDVLLVGTTKTEYAITSGTDQALSISSIFVKAISGHGSSKVQPVKAGSSVLFVAADGRRVLEIPKKLTEYANATDLTILAQGIIDKAITLNMVQTPVIPPTSNVIVKLAWQETQGIVWALCRANNGSFASVSSLLSLTFDKTAKVNGWAKHKIAGTPYISSMAVIPDENKFDHPRLFFMGKRDSYYTLEYIGLSINIDKLLPSSQDSADFGGKRSTYMDCTGGGTVSGTNLNLSAGYLECFPAGTTYAVFGTQDVFGNQWTYLGDHVESGGSLTTIPNISSYTDIAIGVRYEGEIKTMPFEAGAQFGVAQGSARRTHEISIYLDRSLGGVYKAAGSSDYFNIITDTAYTPDNLFTGEAKLSLNASPSDNQVSIKQTLPYPFTVLWILQKGYTYDA